MEHVKIKNGYVFFWDGWPSNWTRSPFLDGNDGTFYGCVEQYMMAQKAILFDDREAYKLIMDAEHPARQKELGRIVRNFDQDKWDEAKFDIVLKGTLEKYKQNDDLRALLFSTGDAMFVEASPHDRIWGIGMRDDDPNIDDQTKWGQNLLGDIITEARSILRKEY